MERGNGYNDNQSWNSYQQQGSQGMPYGAPVNIQLNSGADGFGIEKKGDLGKISIILTIMGLFCCGITTIPGIICGIIAFVKDKRNATNIAAMVLATIELAVWALLIFCGVVDSVSDDAKVSDLNLSGHERIFLETREENGSLIYDKNDIIIYYNGINSSLDFKFYARNNSNQDIKIKCDSLYVNGYNFGGYMTIDLAAGEKGNDTMNLSVYQMNKNDIDASDINEVSGTITIINSETEQEIDNFEFSIK